MFRNLCAAVLGRPRRSDAGCAMVFAPRILAIALRLGTLVGCKRIVVTVGEKIGNTHLTDAQGTSADLVARLTIRAADIDGLPLSTPRRQAPTGGPSWRAERRVLYPDGL